MDRFKSFTRSTFRKEIKSTPTYLKKTIQKTFWAFIFCLKKKKQQNWISNFVHVEILIDKVQYIRIKRLIKQTFLLQVSLALLTKLIKILCFKLRQKIKKFTSFIKNYGHTISLSKPQSKIALKVTSEINLCSTSTLLPLPNLIHRKTFFFSLKCFPEA